MSISHFPLLLRQERILRGWTQQYIADELGIGRVTVIRWESGKATPSLSMRIPLCELFEKRMEEFFPVDTSSLLKFPLASSQLMVVKAEIDATNIRQTNLTCNEDVTQVQYQQSSLVDYQNDGEIPLNGRTIIFNTEEQYLDVQLKHLEIQKKCVEYTIDIANQLIDVLDPMCDSGVRSLVLEELLTNLPKFYGGEEQKIPLPTLESVRDTLELAKWHKAQKNFLKEDSVGAEPIKTVPLIDNFFGFTSGARVDYIQTESSPSTLPNEPENNVATLSVGTAALKSRLISPYDNFATIRDSQMFFGRSREVHLLYSSLANRQCVSLVGARHIGKSSLLQCMSDREMQQKIGYKEALQKHIFILQDLRESSVLKTSEDFFNKIISNLISQCKEHLLLEMPKEQGALGFSNLLDEMSHYGFHPVILLDEFDKIASNSCFDESFFSFLRALANMGKVSYITASLSPLHKITHSSIVSSPFFNIFRSETIGALEMEEAVELITGPSARVGLPCSSEQVDWIIEKAGRHPFFLQVSCYHLLEEKSKLKTGQSLDFEQLAMKIYTELAPHFESIWKDLSQVQQSNLRYEMQRANRPDQGRSIADKMEELSESALFRHYIRTTFHVEQAELSSEELKTILEHYQDPDFLAKSVLATMHYVEAMRDGNNAGSHQIGTLVQKFLYEAFERMKPAGTRDDFSEVWRSYNILHFRYIRHHLATELVPPRIGIGRRQYFRSLEMAIKTLRHHLLALNNEFFNL